MSESQKYDTAIYKITVKAMLDLIFFGLLYKKIHIIPQNMPPKEQFLHIRKYEMYIKIQSKARDDLNVWL
jgi:thioredoxin-related protein